MERCKSTFCVTNDSIRGRLFEPSEKAQGIAKVWCPQCLSIGKQISFFSIQTAEMIRGTYKMYINTNLPKESKLILEQFAREIITEFGEEL